jgi:transketolase
VDGHNIEELLTTFQSAPFQKGKPSMIIADTIKSKGMPFAEGNVKYHHWNPGKDSKEARDALSALENYAIEKGWKL